MNCDICGCSQQFTWVAHTWQSAVCRLPSHTSYQPISKHHERVCTRMIITNASRRRDKNEDVLAKGEEHVKAAT